MYSSDCVVRCMYSSDCVVRCMYSSDCVVQCIYSTDLHTSPCRMYNVYTYYMQLFGGSQVQPDSIFVVEVDESHRFTQRKPQLLWSINFNPLVLYTWPSFLCRSALTRSSFRLPFQLPSAAGSQPALLGSSGCQYPELGSCTCQGEMYMYTMRCKIWDQPAELHGS